MSIYMCKECDRIRDCDYDGCYEDPRNGPTDYDLLCEDCIGGVEEEVEQDAAVSQIMGGAAVPEPVELVPGFSAEVSRIMRGAQ